MHGQYLGELSAVLQGRSLGPAALASEHERGGNRDEPYSQHNGTGIGKSALVQKAVGRSADPPPWSQTSEEDPKNVWI